MQNSDIDTKNYDQNIFTSEKEEGREGPENLMIIKLMEEIKQMKSHISKVESVNKQKIKDLEGENKRLKSELSLSKKIIEKLTNEDQKLKSEIIKMKNDKKDSPFETLEDNASDPRPIKHLNEDKEEVQIIKQESTQKMISK